MFQEKILLSVSETILYLS